MARASAWKARACRPSALRNIAPTKRSNRSIAWSVRLAAEVQADGDQRRMPALPLVAGDMLDRGAAGLAGELGQARLVDEMAAAGSMPIPRTCSRRSIRPSMAAGLAASGICRSQVSQFWPVFSRRCVSASRRRRCSADRPSVSRRCTSRRALMTHFGAEPLECRGPWQDDPALPALLPRPARPSGPAGRSRWPAGAATSRSSAAGVFRTDASRSWSCSSAAWRRRLRSGREVFVDRIREERRPVRPRRPP